MAMASSSGGGPMANINVTPLVDVMLVLLIIFMITTPLMAHKVKVELPKATLEEKVILEQPPITLSVKPNGQVYWNDEAVTQDQLEARLAVIAQRQPQPQVDVRSDDVTKYGVIHDVTRTVRLAGIRKIGFVSSPER